MRGDDALLLDMLIAARKIRRFTSYRPTRRTTTTYSDARETQQLLTGVARVGIKE